jgi:hypothetical protein
MTKGAIRDRRASPHPLGEREAEGQLRRFRRRAAGRREGGEPAGAKIFQYRHERLQEAQDHPGERPRRPLPRRRGGKRRTHLFQYAPASFGRRWGGFGFHSCLGSVIQGDHTRAALSGQGKNTNIWRIFTRLARKAGSLDVGVVLVQHTQHKAAAPRRTDWPWVGLLGKWRSVHLPNRSGCGGRSSLFGSREALLAARRKSRARRGSSHGGPRTRR